MPRDLLAERAPRDLLADSAATQPPSPMPTFLNRGIANTSGALVDLANAGLSLLGLGSENPAGGSRFFESGLRALEGVTGGQIVPRPDERATTLGQQVLRGVGESAGALLPFGVGAKALQYGGGPLSRNVAEILLSKPKTGAALDILAGAGAGTGRNVGEAIAPKGQEERYGRYGELFGGLGLGITPAAVNFAGKAAMKLPIAGTAARAAQKGALSFTKPGASIRASDRVRGLVPDPTVAEARLSEKGIVKLPPAVKTGERRLMALQKAISDLDPTIEKKLQDTTEEAGRTLRDELRGLGVDSPAAREFIEKRYNVAVDRVRSFQQRAVARAKAKVARAQSSNNATDNAMIVREELEAELEKQTKIEAAKWRAVPADLPASTANSKSAFKAVVDETPKSQMDDIPAIAKRFLGNDKGAYGDTETLGELKGLRTKLLEIKRQAKSRGQNNQARIAGDLARAVLDDMMSVEGAQKALNEARAFSKALHDTFETGPVGTVFETTTHGAARVEPELTLETTVGRQGLRGAVASDRITAAAPRTQSVVADDIRRMFEKEAVKDGLVDPAAANRFIARNEELLAKHPGVRQDIDDAMQSSATAASAVRSGDRALKRLENRSKSYSARFLNANVDDEVSSVFSARDPVSFAKELRRQVAKDKTGRALEGLRASAIDFLIGKAGKGNDLSGSAIAGILNDPRSGGAMRAFFEPHQIGRIKRIAHELSLLETARGQLPSVGNPMEDAPAALLSIVTRIAGARAGAWMGGHDVAGGLQSAQIMSGRAKKLLEGLTRDRAAQLLSDSVLDDDLYRTLLMPTRTAKQRTRASMALGAWLVGPGKRYFEDSEDK